MHLVGRSAVGDPAFVAFDDAGDGGLVEFELLGDPGLLVAVEFDPAVDQAVAVGGGPGAGGGGLWLSWRGLLGLGFRILDFRFWISDLGFEIAGENWPRMNAGDTDRRVGALWFWQYLYICIVYVKRGVVDPENWPTVEENGPTLKWQFLEV